MKIGKSGKVLPQWTVQSTDYCHIAAVFLSLVTIFLFPSVFSILLITLSVFRVCCFQTYNVGLKFPLFSVFCISRLRNTKITE